MTDLRFAVVQSGHCVWGVGHTREQAIVDAAKWIEPKDGRQGDMTPDQVEELCFSRPVDGDFYVLSQADDPESFDSYMESQGGYPHVSGKWYDADIDQTT